MKSMRKIRRLIALSLPVFCAGISRAYQGYNIVVTTDPVVEAAFLASTTNQFNAALYGNPIFAGTYQIGILGLNPAYVPPVVTMPTSTGAYIVQIGSNTHTVYTSTWAINEVYDAGWVNGAGYQQWSNVQNNDWLELNCSTGPANLGSIFTLFQASTGTWSAATCMDAINTINTTIYDEYNSTPTVIPPWVPFQ